MWQKSSGKHFSGKIPRQNQDKKIGKFLVFINISGVYIDTIKQPETLILLEKTKISGCFR